MNTSISFLGMLTIVFIALKLSNFIDWSWLWIFAPLWAPASICASIAIFFFIIAMIIKVIK